MFTRRDVMVLRFYMIAAVFVLALLSACVPSGESELEFTETLDQPTQDVDGEQTADQETVRGAVEIAGEQQRKRLLILPFSNASGSSKIDVFVKGLPGLIKAIFDNDRFISPSIADSNSHLSLMRSSGLAPGEIANMEIASRYHEEQDVDVVLCGRIFYRDRDVIVIEPRIFSFTGGENREEDLPPMRVSLSNFVHFVNPLAEKIRDMMVEIR